MAAGAGRAGARAARLQRVAHRGRRDILPSVRRYRRVFRRFRRRYPFVRDFVSWNEANHGSQPTAAGPIASRPTTTSIRDDCPRCSVVAADVLDGARCRPACRPFRRARTPSPADLGPAQLHRRQPLPHDRDPRAAARRPAARVWFTETGGLVWRRHGPHTVPLGESPAHAARAVRWVFKLAAPEPAHQRMYFYHWSFPARRDRWDSALHGPPRPPAARLPRAAPSHPRGAPPMRRLALLLAARRARGLWLGQRRRCGHHRRRRGRRATS